MKKFILSSSLILASFNVFSQTLEATETEALLTVSVINSKKQPQEGETVMFEGTKTKKSYTGITKANGKFAILIPEGDKYKIKYKSFGDDKDYNTIDIPSKPGMINFDYTLTVELPKTYTLNNVFFDTGKSSLRQESYKELNQLSEFMKLKKSLVIEIAGHTDNVGNKDANQKLSEGRANTVRDYLIKKGISAERVVAIGYGDTQPVASNDTNEGKQQNRRTEVRIVKE